MAKNKKKGGIIALIVTGSILVSIVAAGGIYFSIYQHADSYALENLQSSSLVTVEEEKGAVVFTPKIPNGKGLIFYQGGKVENKAYAPLLNSLAKAGYLCILPDMPLNFALFNQNAAQTYLSRFPSTSFYIGGHSLGGMTAGLFASEHPSSLKGLVLLGSYCTKDLTSTSLKTISITATNDTVLTWSAYEANKGNLPNLSEHSVEGGIHSYFGSYGIQKGDGNPTITVKEQTTEVATYLALHMI